MAGGGMMGVLYVRGDRARARADPEAQTFFFSGQSPRILYRLRLGMASLLTTEVEQVVRLRAARAPVEIEVISVEDDDAGQTLWTGPACP
jgi:hypothetical protein